MTPSDPQQPGRHAAPPPVPPAPGSRVPQPVPRAAPRPVPAPSPQPTPAAGNPAVPRPMPVPGGKQPMPRPTGVPVAGGAPMEEEDQRNWYERYIKQAPPWMISAVTQMLLIIVMGLWLLPPPKNEGV